MLPLEILETRQGAIQSDVATLLVDSTHVAGQWSRYERNPGGELPFHLHIEIADLVERLVI